MSMVFLTPCASSFFLESSPAQHVSDFHTHLNHRAFLLLPSRAAAVAGLQLDRSGDFFPLNRNEVVLGLPFESILNAFLSGD